MTNYIPDSELTLNKKYYAVIVDKNLGDLCGQEIIVLFTGIAFRNVKYLVEGVHQYSNNEDDNLRKRMTDTRLAEKKDAIFMLDQIRLFREVKSNDLFESNL
jgi:hypothetical protein